MKEFTCCIAASLVGSWLLNRETLGASLAGCIVLPAIMFPVVVLVARRLF